jgi:hypothetical protein
MRDLFARNPKATRGGEFANLATGGVPRLNSLEPKVVAVLGRRPRCPRLLTEYANQRLPRRWRHWCPSRSGLWRLGWGPGTFDGGCLGMDHEDSTGLELLLERSVPAVACVSGPQGERPPLQLSIALQLSEQSTQRESGKRRKGNGRDEYVECDRLCVVRPGCRAPDIVVDETGPSGECHEGLDDNRVEQGAENCFEVSTGGSSRPLGLLRLDEHEPGEDEQEERNEGSECRDHAPRGYAPLRTVQLDRVVCGPPPPGPSSAL